MHKRWGKISKLRKQVYARSGGLCHYCGCAMVLTKRPHADAVTVDHIIPACKGGTRAADNVVGACLTCNGARGAKLYEAFVAHVKANGRPAPPKLPTFPQRSTLKAKRKALVSAPSASRHLPAAQPYEGAAKFPTLADAFRDAGLVPEEGS